MPLNRPVSVKEIVEELEIQTDESNSYLHKTSGELVSVTDEAVRAAENRDPLEAHPEWMRPMILQARDLLECQENYLPLRSKWDIHEYGIMKDFCHSIGDPRIRDVSWTGFEAGGRFGDSRRASSQWGSLMIGINFGKRPWSRS